MKCILKYLEVSILTETLMDRYMIKYIYSNVDYRIQVVGIQVFTVKFFQLSYILESFYDKMLREKSVFNFIKKYTKLPLIFK